jgi:hypothetical protein
MKQTVTVNQVADAFARPLISRDPVLFGKSPIELIVDSIKDYKRKLRIYPAYKELKEVYKLFTNDKDKLIKRLITESDLNTEEVNEVPPAKKQEFDAEIDKMLNADYQMRSVLRFTPDEINASGLPLSQWELVEAFVDFKATESKEK